MILLLLVTAGYGYRQFSVCRQAEQLISSFVHSLNTGDFKSASMMLDSNAALAEENSSHSRILSAILATTTIRILDSHRIEDSVMVTVAISAVDMQQVNSQIGQNLATGGYESMLNISKGSDPEEVRSVVEKIYISAINSADRQMRTETVSVRIFEKNGRPVIRDSIELADAITGGLAGAPQR